MISEIIPGLYIGDASDARLLDRNKFTIVTVQEEAQFIGDYYFPMKDGGDTNPEDVKKAADLLQTLVGGPKLVCIHCGAGASRSPTVTLLYLSRTMNFDDAYNLIRQKRPVANINPGLFDLVKKIHEDEVKMRPS